MPALLYSWTLAHPLNRTLEGHGGVVMVLKALERVHALRSPADPLLRPLGPSLRALPLAALPLAVGALGQYLARWPRCPRWYQILRKLRLLAAHAQFETILAQPALPKARLVHRGALLSTVVLGAVFPLHLLVARKVMGTCPAELLVTQAITLLSIVDVAPRPEDLPTIATSMCAS